MGQSRWAFCSPATPRSRTATARCSSLENVCRKDSRSSLERRPTRSGEAAVLPITRGTRVWLEWPLNCLISTASTNDLRHDAGCGSGLRAARSRRLASARCCAEPSAGALLGRDAPPRDHRDRLAGTTAYALEATVALDIIHVAAATRRAVLVVGSSKGLSAFGPRPDGSRPAHGDTWLQLRRFSAAAGAGALMRTETSHEAREDQRKSPIGR